MYLKSHRTTLEYVISCLSHQIPVTLLFVVESEGSSPGRRGFLMAATADECIGTIGGGIMEFKIVELARSLLQSGSHTIRLITQYHDKLHTKDQSGMICSGMQRIALVPMTPGQMNLIKSWLRCLTENENGVLQITPAEMSLHTEQGQTTGFLYVSETDWSFLEKLGTRPRLHIIGAGHISLALSELMSGLGYFIIVYDDRQNLNTFSDNFFADEKHIVDLSGIGGSVDIRPQDFVAIMTLGYRTDKIVLRQLLDRSCSYLGLLGSRQKIEEIFREMKNEGIAQEALDKVYAPIGLTINSQTAQEIAVSIAAEMIRVKYEREALKIAPTQVSAPG